MKKSAIFLLLTVTLVFISFVSGVYVGRNFSSPGVRIENQTTAPTTASALSPLPESSTTPASSDMPSTPKATKPVYPININTATAEELDLLPDIGPTRAQAIIAYRAEYGPFTSIEDLLHVNGIGEKILAKILPYITV